MTATGGGEARRSEGGLLAGLIGAAVATGGMLAVGFASDQPTIAETVADGIARVTPLETVEHMTATFGESAKHLLFATVLVGEVALGAILGVIHARRRWSAIKSFTALSALVTLVALGVALVALPALGEGVLGARSRAGAGGTLFSLLATAALFVLGYVAADHALNPTGLFAVEEAASRRAFVTKTIIAGGGLVVGIGAFQWLAEHLTPGAGSAASGEALRTNAALAGAGDLVEALANGVPGLSPEITPNEKFYVVSKNVLRDPVVNEQTWRLEVAGLVNRPMTLTYEDVKALPAASQYFTLQCISNAVGGSLIGNAEWRGIRLSALLGQAGVKAGAVDVVLRAADDYVDSIPIQKAMESGTMLAYEMNGEVLPKAHGFPVRLLVPDIYGMKNVKWITKIEVIEYDLKGYWQTKGWDDTATMHTTSRIDIPKNGSNLLAGQSFVGGIAVAGSRGIRKVEVSTDGGGSWGPATIKPALGPDSWVLWLYPWELSAGEAEPRRILVRATDGTGVLQTSVVSDALPAGSSGYHAITVRRAEA